jgi:putative selenium metabolism hydrolase
MRALGFESVRADEVGNVIGVIPGNEGRPSVMLNAHLDVVGEGDPAEWEFPPFSGVVDGGFLHGRGAMDIKGPLALQTYAAASLLGRVRGDVIVAHTVYEERGGLGMKSLLEAGEVRPDAVVLGEATHGDICVGHRGRAEFEICIRGIAGHASVPDRARNALDLLPQVLETVKRMAATQPANPTLGRASLVATDVGVLPQSRNVIPDQVTVALDWRILPEQTSATLVLSLERALAESLGDLPQGYSLTVRPSTERQRTYTGLERARELFTPGFLLSVDHPLVQAAARAVGRRSSPDAADARPWAFATDGGWSSGVHGIPTLGFAPGEERFAHTNRERLDVEEARWAFDRYPDLVVAMQGALLEMRG